MKIFIDPGHGGTDPGACSGNLIEKNMNLITATATAEYLQKYGCEVKLSRTTDTYLSLTGRANMANNWGADYFVSCHYNAGGGDRGEVIHSVTHGSSYNLAQAIGSRLANLGQTQLNLYDKKASSGTGDYFTVIAKSKAPAVIVEPCFIDNEQDRQIADTESEQKEIGVAIAKGVLDLLGIKYNESEDEEMKMIYNYIDENMPSWAQPTIQKLVDKGYLKGNENGELGLDDTMLKLLVINDRAGLYN